MVKNQCLKTLSSNKPTINIDLSQLIINEYDPFTPDKLLEFQQLKTKIDSLIKLLPTRKQKAFLLSRIHNKTYFEIAVILGVSIKTIESDISFALNFLKSNIYILTIINLTSIG